MFQISVCFDLHKTGRLYGLLKLQIIAKPHFIDLSMPKKSLD